MPPCNVQGLSQCSGQLAYCRERPRLSKLKADVLGVLAGEWFPANTGNATVGSLENGGRRSASEVAGGAGVSGGPRENGGCILNCEAPNMPDRSLCCCSAVLQADHSK